MTGFSSTFLSPSGAPSQHLRLSSSSPCSVNRGVPLPSTLTSHVSHCLSLVGLQFPQPQCTDGTPRRHSTQRWQPCLQFLPSSCKSECLAAHCTSSHERSMTLLTHHVKTEFFPHLSPAVLSVAPASVQLPKPQTQKQSTPPPSPPSPYPRTCQGWGIQVEMSIRKLDT